MHISPTVLPDIRQPFYTLDVWVESCVSACCINDYPIFEDRDGGTGGTEFPVSQWLGSGTNHVELVLHPLPGAAALGPGASGRVAVKLYDYSQWRPDSQDPGHVITAYRFPGPGPSEVPGSPWTLERGPAEVRLACTFEARLPYPDPRFRTADRIPRDDRTVAALWQKTHAYYRLLATRDLAGLLRLHAERDVELGRCLYRDSQAQTERTARFYQDLFDDATLRLQPLRNEGYLLRLLANNRLARLEDAAGDPPVVFVARDQSYGHFLELNWMRRGQDLVLAR